jgi:hypothetical protein
VPWYPKGTPVVDWAEAGSFFGWAILPVLTIWAFGYGVGLIIKVVRDA